MTLRELIARRIRTRGPLTTAEFMELALYHSSLGYYSRAPRRTGRAGDFFTSVDVGPQFGALLASQLEEMYRLLGDSAPDGFDLVEAGAANGQLARDILDAAEAAGTGAGSGVSLPDLCGIAECSGGGSACLRRSHK